MRIVFFGTSSFAAQVLLFLVGKKVNIVAVVTRPDRPRGRNLLPSSSPVKEAGLGISLPVYQPEKASTPEFAAELSSLQADLFLVVAYGEILRQNILSLPSLGCVNIHASLLPRYRGAAPIQRALMDGVQETGITLIEMAPQMDAGAILRIAKTPVPYDMNFGQLEAVLCSLACTETLALLQQAPASLQCKVSQDHRQATLAPKLIPQEEQIDWSQSSIFLHNQIRALSPKPGAWTTLLFQKEGKLCVIKKLKILRAVPATPGQVGWIIPCGKGALQLLEVQLEGKKALPVAEFLKGHPLVNLKIS